jgi:hypothetical protein
MSAATLARTPSPGWANWLAGTRFRAEYSVPEHIRLAETRLRAGSAWDMCETARDTLRSPGSWRDSAADLAGSCCGLYQRGFGQLTRYAIEATASADPRGIFYRPIMGRFPETVTRHSTRRARRPFGGAGLSRGSVSQMEQTGQVGRWDVMLILHRQRRNFLSLGPWGCRGNASSCLRARPYNSYKG